MSEGCQVTTRYTIYPNAMACGMGHALADDCDGLLSVLSMIGPDCENWQKFIDRWKDQSEVFILTPSMALVY